MQKTYRSLGAALAALALSVVSTVGCATTVVRSDVATAADTVANLQNAFNGESNASARYAEFAKKADADGYAKVAALFRAAAKAEEIHAANHAAVIKELGATPVADVKTPVIGTTRQNLETALAGEIAERDQMYPAYIKQARDVGLPGAVRTLSLAQKAEACHAQLYGAALADLNEWTGTSTFYVCSVCGYTSAIPKAACPSCLSPKEAFILVS
jgi:rubrerythrin